MKNAIASNARGRRRLFLLDDLGGLLSSGAALSRAELSASLFLEGKGGDGTGQITGGKGETVVLLLLMIMPSALPPPFACKVLPRLACVASSFFTIAIGAAADELIVFTR